MKAVVRQTKSMIFFLLWPNLGAFFPFFSGGRMSNWCILMSLMVLALVMARHCGCVTAASWHTDKIGIDSSSSIDSSISSSSSIGSSSSAALDAVLGWAESEIIYSRWKSWFYSKAVPNLCTGLQICIPQVHNMAKILGTKRLILSSIVCMRINVHVTSINVL